jgi:hypothetical protein
MGIESTTPRSLSVKQVLKGNVPHLRLSESGARRPKSHIKRLTSSVAPCSGEYFPEGKDAAEERFLLFVFADQVVALGVLVEKRQKGGIQTQGPNRASCCFLFCRDAET